MALLIHLYFQQYTGEQCIDPTEDPEIRLDMNRMCAKKVGSSAGVMSVTEDPDDQCSGLKCTVPLPNGSFKAVMEMQPVPDGSFPCGGGTGSPGVSLRTWRIFKF